MPVEIAPGELLDKITVMELKTAHLTDPTQLAHVGSELAELTAARLGVPAVPGMDELVRELAGVNAAIWAVEEQAREFGPEFVEARAMYRYNDHRAQQPADPRDRLALAEGMGRSVAALGVCPLRRNNHRPAARQAAGAPQ